MTRIFDLSRAAIATLALLTASSFAAPATPSHQPIMVSIENVRAVWKDGKLPIDANIQAWETFFTALQSDLKLAASANAFADREAAYARLRQHDTALSVIAWAPAVNLRSTLSQWLTPRLQMVDTERQFRATLATVSPQTDPTGALCRDGWIKYVDTDLGAAIREYEKASTVSAKLQGLDRLRASLAALNASNISHPWAPSQLLQGAITQLYDQPNLDISADVSSVAPFLANNLITTGPVYRKGYVSQVTAGPHA